MKWFVFLCLLTVQTVASPITDVKYTPTVNINSGPVRGLVETVEGEDIYFYQGIRFGKVSLWWSVALFLIVCL